MSAISRIWTFTSFTFAEYVRSGRILIEAIATLLFWGLFLRQYPVMPDHFFSLASILTLLMALYTTTAVMSLGERPQGYVVLTRPLGRGGYLLSLYFVVLIVVTLMFALLTAVTLIYNRFVFDPLGPFGVADVLKGALPLLLNVGLMSALVVLLSSMVLTNAVRLLVLAVLAIALYSQAWHLWPAFRFIEPFQSVFSWLVYPAIAGFHLATTRDFSGGAIYVPIAQFALAVLLISFAISSFKRRDIILRNQ